MQKAEGKTPNVLPWAFCLLPFFLCLLQADASGLGRAPASLEPDAWRPGPAGAQHGAHRLPPIPVEILERPVTLRTGIGRVHHDTSTRSNDAQALYDQGLSYLHSYVWIEAARSFNAALRLDPKLALAHAGLSVAYVELSRPAEARKAMDAAHALAPQLADHERRHVEARALQMAAEATPADVAKLAAYRKALDTAIAAFPQDVEFVLLRGIAESSDPADRGQGSVAGSAPYYERALALSPGHLAAHHYLAHAHENAGHLTAAREHSSAFARQAPGVPHARHMHGHSLRRSGRVDEAIAEFEAADRLHREYATRENIALEYDWHFEHNLGLLATSLQYTGQVKRAETLMKAAFALPTNLLAQAYNKREWPMFLRARGRHAEAEAAARILMANPNPVVQATGQIEVGFVMLGMQRWGDAAAASNVALKLLRTSPGGAIAAHALQALQGEFNLRTADRTKGRAMLEDVAGKMRAAPGPDPWGQALFQLEAIARAAREVGDWELAGRMGRHMVAHDSSYAGSHYALALVAEHDDDAATAKTEFALALKYWAKADADLPELSAIRKRVK
jgi:tetratricopeptide (TPR) repeat protein